MAAATSVFHRVRTGSKIGAQYDQDGNIIQVETREDEEQSVKLAEILELLLAAGYFRARIKGLSPFDKWLVKRAIETREEMGDYIRAYSISQFNKTHKLPEDVEFEQRKGKAVKTVLEVLDVYKPQRKYRRQRDAADLTDEESRVQSTLLEYGRRYGFSKQTKQDKVDGQKTVSGVSPSGADMSEEQDLQEVEEMRIKTLMTNMAAMAIEEGKLTASAVGQIVGLQSEEIKQIASEYKEKQSELSSEELSERYGPLQQHRRAVASLHKQIQQRSKALEELQAKHEEAKASCDEAKRKLTEVTEESSRLEKELLTLEEMEKSADPTVLEKLRSLVTMNDSLKQQEHEFKTHCREEMTRLQEDIEKLKTASGQDNEEEKERNQLIDQQHSAEREKLQKIRMLMARRNREIAILQRKIDEVPSRAELTQYQKRFIELYSQVSATHKETKQFFTLYNTLDDKKLYLEKEANLLNSIHDNFQQAMSSAGAKEQFLRQMEQIVEGIKQSRIKECRKNEMLLSKLQSKGAS
ncbi:hypothetical protein NQD34_015659 [Periophthalmus magnuspinnatus]|nr:hypothetical protein NQD34_015659 [Periophthalmus magnuspinnatus]